MATTGYSDTFNRTVSGGLGVATSGQTYTLNGVAAQFSVAPNVASVAISSAGDKFGYVDRQTQDIDITAQVALSGIPASNLATVGFVMKLATISSYYSATMMVATGGAISLRFSKVVSGSLSTIATVATGLTYVANTFYNLRATAVWSQGIGTNILQAKLWALNAAQPGSWMATATDFSATLSQYTAGTNAGIFARDESTTVGTITAKIQNVAVASYSLPIPATTDPMCASPVVLQSMASTVDTAMATLDPLVALSQAFPRVRLSATLAQIPQTLPSSSTISYDTMEFNIGTPTNLGTDNQALYLPAGIWLVTFEFNLTDAAALNAIQVFSNALLTPNFVNVGVVNIGARANVSNSNDQSVGGCAHFSATVYSADPTTPIRYTVGMSTFNGQKYTATYVALTALKISDYFS